ncbi:MAG: ketol-acid reductoisomerase [Gammaproteobacteria bacterium]
MPMIKFGNVNEQVTTREEFSLQKAKEVLKNEIIAIIGYGVQGPAQALNLRDNGFDVIIGQRENSPSWEKAITDGWVPGKNLFDIEAACEKATFICNLLSDAAQIQLWPVVKKYLTTGKTLYFSHGFAVTYHDKTGIVPPKDIDVILAAPKGSGRSVRKLFLAGKGINSSYAVYQDYSGKAEEKALAFGIAIGSGYLFKTTFQNEVYSDLAGERGVLMGALAGIIKAQYEVLRKNGHSPSEAFNETVEELTQSLVPLVAENGMDWMFGNCSTTAQRGALDWMPRFKEATQPVFEALYESVKSGKEAEIVIEANSRPDYRERLSVELKSIHDEELWEAGRKVRELRPVEESK